MEYAVFSADISYVIFLLKRSVDTRDWSPSVSNRETCHVLLIQ